jgi:hypothetical protein
MTTGAGLAPFGTAPAGVGLPVSSPALAAAGYGLSTTGAVSSIEIDPVTRDTVFDAYGSETGMADTAQRVWMLCETVQGSRANYPTSGLAKPLKAGGDDLVLVVEGLFRQALAPVVDDGSITIDSVTVETDPLRPTYVYALVEWTELRTNSKQTTKAPLQF